MSDVVLPPKMCVPTYGDCKISHRTYTINNTKSDFAEPNQIASLFSELIIIIIIIIITVCSIYVFFLFFFTMKTMSISLTLSNDRISIHTERSQYKFKFNALLLLFTKKKYSVHIIFMCIWYIIRI